MILQNIQIKWNKRKQCNISKILPLKTEHNLSKLPFTYVLKTKFSILLCTRLLLMKLGYLDFRNLELVVGSSELYSFLGLCGFCNEWYHYFDYPAWESSCHFLERIVTFRFSFFFFFSNSLFCCRCHNEVKYISDVPFLLVYTSLRDLWLWSFWFGL